MTDLIPIGRRYMKYSGKKKESRGFSEKEGRNAEGRHFGNKKKDSRPKVHKTIELKEEGEGRETASQDFGQGCAL